MNFDFSEDQKLLQKTTRDFLEDNSPLSVCREVLESDQPYAQKLWKACAEMGYQGTVIPEEYGGAGFGHLELAVVAEELGRALAPLPFSSSVYLATEAILLAGSEEQKQQYLPKLASGESIGSFALVEGAGQNATEKVETRLEGGKLTGTKLPVLDGDVADFAVVAAQSGSGLSLAIVDLEGKGVARESLRSFDPARSMGKITLDRAPASVLGKEGEGEALAAQLLDRAAVLTAFEQIGGADRAFELTVEFMRGRYAFGRPIASFQALKHRLADLWCELQLARSNSYYGIWALHNDDPELSVAACIARIAASKAFDLASVEMVQMHGGVGYTWEYDCHLFYRRSKLLSVALGSPASWKDRLIDRLREQKAA